jgi:aspartate aminotransferase
MKISQRVRDLEESATIAVSNRAASMRTEGIDVVGLGQGEPDFPTPAHIVDAAVQALRAGETKYPRPFSGIPSLKAAICRKLARENGLHYQPDDTIATVGGKEGLWLAFATLLDPGDEVVVPAPYWVSYVEQIRFCGGVPVVVETDVQSGYKITPGQLRAALTPRTRAFVFTSPSNPTGAVYTPEETRALAEVLEGREVAVIADEIYDRLVYGGLSQFSWARASAHAFDHTITFNAGSKTYAMTGWRIGYAAGPRAIIEQMAKLQSQTTSSAATFSMHALAAALDGDQSCVEDMRQEFERRGNLLVSRLNAIPGVACPSPQGAFYVFPDVSGTGRTGDEIADMLLHDAGVSVLSGTAFGEVGTKHIRLSYANSRDAISRAIDKMRTALEPVAAGS